MHWLAAQAANGGRGGFFYAREQASKQASMECIDGRTSRHGFCYFFFSLSTRADLEAQGIQWVLVYLYLSR